MARPGQVLRFALVGGGVAVLYLLLYLAALRLGMAQIPANALAFLAAVTVQYVGQAGFTFGRRLRDGGQILRFGTMVSLGLATSALITGLGPALSLADWAAAGIVMLWLPVQNYLLMALWVFVSPAARKDVSK